MATINRKERAGKGKHDEWDVKKVQQQEKNGQFIRG